MARVVTFVVIGVVMANAYIIDPKGVSIIVNGENSDEFKNKEDVEINENYAAEAFNGVYTECFLYLSYACIQQKTLLYLKKLNDLGEISVFGEYLKFVKTNTSKINTSKLAQDNTSDNEINSSDLSFKIDKAVDNFFDNHVLRFKALGRDITVPRTVDEFVGRKKRKGGGGGGGGHHDGDDGGKKKMMMMAMMCMKMKLMMMVPAMMGMMGMVSFKGMMFSMMSFMMTKMMLLMKIMEKKGGFGGGGGGGDAGWAMGGGGGGGGAWMPAGGQDYGGGGGGGYDANGQWQSRSIPQNLPEEISNRNSPPEISYVKSVVRYKNSGKKPMNLVKNINDEDVKLDSNHSEQDAPKSRKKRGIMDVLQNAYIYWINRLLGIRRYNKMNNLANTPKYRIVNGVKYVYYPLKSANKVKVPKYIQPEATTPIKVEDGFKPVINVDDFNKGEIVDTPMAESRMNKKKLHKIKETVNAAIEDNPWQ